MLVVRVLAVKKIIINEGESDFQLHYLVFLKQDI